MIGVGGETESMLSVLLSMFEFHVCEAAGSQSNEFNHPPFREGQKEDDLPFLMRPTSKTLHSLLRKGQMEDELWQFKEQLPTAPLTSKIEESPVKLS